MRPRNRNNVVGLRNLRRFMIFLLFPLLFLTITLSTVYFVSKDIEGEGVDGQRLAPLEHRLGITNVFEKRNSSQLKADEFNWRNRVYCMVPTMYNRHQVNLMTAIVGGWGAYCDVLKFFVDPAGKGNVALDDADFGLHTGSFFVDC